MGEENKCNEDDYPWELGVYHCGFAIPLWGKHLRILDKRERERERETTNSKSKSWSMTIRPSSSIYFGFVFTFSLVFFLE